MNVLKLMREQAGLTVEQVAERIGYPTSRLAHLESVANDSSELTVVAVGRVAQATGAGARVFDQVVKELAQAGELRRAG